MTISELENQNREIMLAECLAQYNDKIGNLDSSVYDCPICKNKGLVWYADDTGIHSKECSCMSERRMLTLAKQSGLGELLKVCKFDDYIYLNEEWRKRTYDRARSFVNDNKPFFFIGGQVGCGKSFTCIAMINEFLKKGIDCKFIVWNDFVTTLKQNIVANADLYNDMLNEVKTATVLYIDDFFRTTPTTADIDKAFSIINYRYNQSKMNNKQMFTIISSEKILSELQEINEAIGTRISELATPKYTVNIARDKERNLRTRKKCTNK